MRICVLGGGDFFGVLNVPVLSTQKITTPYGETVSDIREARIGEHQVFAMVRHGHQHQIAAHKINYRANVWALASLEPDLIISVSVCGGLKSGIPVGSVVMFDQIMDLTSKRVSSFYDEGEVRHISTYQPTLTDLGAALAADLDKAKIENRKDGTLVCIEGPRFSTKAEIGFYQRNGFDYINMSAAPEIFLINETGIPCLGMSLISDSVDESVVNMNSISLNIQKHRENLPQALNILLTQTLAKFVLPARADSQALGKILTDKLDLPK